MLTDPPSGAEPQAKRQRRMVSSIEALNIRIARLAIALRVPLDSDEDVNRLMSWSPSLPIPGEDKRDLNLGMEHQWQELRGLLVLRYTVEINYVDQIGAIATRKILVEAEHHMMLHGFELGDDGVDQHLLLDPV